MHLSDCHSKDILQTLVDIIGVSRDPSFRGYSLANGYQGQDYIITEYPGGGCPDVKSKELWLSIRDDKYMVAYKIRINDDFDSVRPFAVYDLRKDPNAFYNVRNIIKSSDIDYLISALKDYFYGIRERTETFINDLIDNKISL